MTRKKKVGGVAKPLPLFFLLSALSGCSRKTHVIIHDSPEICQDRPTHGVTPYGDFNSNSSIIVVSRRTRLIVGQSGEISLRPRTNPASSRTPNFHKSKEPFVEASFDSSNDNPVAKDAKELQRSIMWAFTD
ncbi:predicted protein [Coccidioides posadasii str. Silveira]|uniref:Predicted protein n=2 Tax=Coccidioides posadasii TaxID=199306 RepID=E9DDW8_COCPS|nr:predicted protein [Coccidioides posadasii str. Silveira]KMM70251.1 hypothetical protein CPAG_06563 [Coccidioides posadasii RMSCC 3488]